MVFLYIFGKKLFEIFAIASLFSLLCEIIAGNSSISVIVTSTIAVIGFCIMQSSVEATEAMDKALKLKMKENKKE